VLPPPERVPLSREREREGAEKKSVKKGRGAAGAASSSSLEGGWEAASSPEPYPIPSHRIPVLGTRPSSTPPDFLIQMCGRVGTTPIAKKTYGGSFLKEKRFSTFYSRILERVARMPKRGREEPQHIKISAVALNLK
jgi:hypothetical protein